MQVHFLRFPPLRVQADALPEHFFLDKGKKLVLFIKEGVDSFVVGDSLIEENLEDVNTGMFCRFFMSGLIEVYHLVFAEREIASVVLRQFQLGDLCY